MSNAQCDNNSVLISQGHHQKKTFNLNFKDALKEPLE